MATSTTNLTDVGSISSRKDTARRYVELGTITDANSNTTTVIKTQSILVESEKKEPEKLQDGSANPNAGKPVNWANAEKQGLKVFNENEFTTYDIKSLDGFALLYPDPKQQLYIIQKGHSAWQTQCIQAAMKANKDGEAEPTPELDGQTIDLRVGVDENGTFGIGTLPSKRGLSLDDKLLKQLVAAGYSEDQAEAAVRALLASMQAAPEAEATA